jgi:hypothetical protein
VRGGATQKVEGALEQFGGLRSVGNEQDAGRAVKVDEHRDLFARDQETA